MHIVAEMDETLIQRCVICGEIIADYRNVLYIKDDGPPTGWSAGRVYVLEGNPKIFKTDLAPADPFLPCNSEQLEKPVGTL